MTGNMLYYGDNLDILRRHIPDESVDLIYLDPPFNSSRNYWIHGQPEKPWTPQIVQGDCKDE